MPAGHGSAASVKIVPGLHGPETERRHPRPRLRPAAGMTHRDGEETMRTGLFTLIGMAMVAVGSSAGAAETPSVVVVGPAAGPACHDLSRLSSAWDAASYSAPEKPMQFYVLGQNGYQTTGPGYRSMVAELRKEAQACENEKLAASRKPADAALSGSSSPNTDTFGNAGRTGSGAQHR